MNKLIKKLAKQSGFGLHKDGEIYTSRLEHLPITEDLEKFAELIVRECIEQVKDQYLPVIEDDIMMKDPKWIGYVHCGVDSVVAIKEHFGVEE